VPGLLEPEFNATYASEEPHDPQWARVVSTYRAVVPFLYPQDFERLSRFICHKSQERETLGKFILKPRSPHFPVFEEFRQASYIERYEILCTKLVRERLYTAACLIVSDREGGLRGRYREPSSELSFENFVGSLSAHALGHAKGRFS